jgi:Fe-S cluster biogenesis protein NfuA/nitrite reductase/ring-hydroxylating ferredoxin subunit
MNSDDNFRRAGERIEKLLDELRAMNEPSTWARVEELMRLVVELYGAGLTRFVNLLDTDLTIDKLRERVLEDELLASLMLLHGLHPEDTAARVARALDRVRPYLGSHGGDVAVVGVDEIAGVVKLRLDGTCDGCPSSALTVKLTVESAIKELAPEIARVEVQGISEHENPLNSMIAKSHVNGTNGNGNAAAKFPEWIALEQQPPRQSGELLVAEVTGERIMICRVGKQLYAYRERCPSCRAPLENGDLDGDVLTCRSCAERYNVRLAGRAIGDKQLHLEPIPLLESGSGVRIAVAGGAA